MYRGKKRATNKRPCQKRRVVRYTLVPNGYEIRTDPVFMELFMDFTLVMRKIAHKKGFNKKEFAGAFRKFDEKLGGYPFPKHLTTRYMKNFMAT